MTDRYALRMPGGGWAYHLTRAMCGDLPPGVIRYGNTEPEWSAEGVPLKKTMRAGWFVHPRRLVTVTATFPGRPSLTGYRLTETGMASPVFPETLTVEEYERRTDEDAEDPPVSPHITASAYERVTEPGPPHVVTVDLFDLVELDGSAPVAVPPGATWEPSLPAALSQYPEYLHLFPGHLKGFRGTLESRLKAIKGLKHVYNFETHSPPEFTVYVELRYDPVQTTPETVQRGRRKPHVVQREVTHDERYKISPPRWIGGRDLADAAARWEAELARWVADFTEIATETPCGHCHGTGLAVRKLAGNGHGKEETPR